MAKSMEELLKNIQNKTKEFAKEKMAGKVIDYDCPACKEKAKLTVLKDGNGKCNKCGEQINIDWNLINK